MKILVGISGASGAHLGFKLAAAISNLTSQDGKAALCDEGTFAPPGPSKVMRPTSRTEFSGSNLNSVQVGVIITEGAREVLASENGFKFELNISNLNKYFKFDLSEDIQIWNAPEISAPPASGSALFDALVVAPCSANTLAKIACGLSDNLLTRAAAVMMKERRKLILAVRETPLSPIALRQMADLSALGVVIAPPAMGYYHAPQTLAQMEDFIIGKWLDALGLGHNLFARWGETQI